MKIWCPYGNLLKVYLSMCFKLHICSFSKFSYMGIPLITIDWRMLSIYDTWLLKQWLTWIFLGMNNIKSIFVNKGICMFFCSLIHVFAPSTIISYIFMRWKKFSLQQAFRDVYTTNSCFSYLCYFRFSLFLVKFSMLFSMFVRFFHINS